MKMNCPKCGSEKTKEIKKSYDPHMVINGEYYISTGFVCNVCKTLFVVAKMKGK